ncbi:hypothetical protein [Marinomonas sp. GJ51-6]|uniref:hypothetical protein n=1 Tax=Marinomonas sp. GJ51-6 TaxID=2992802 RepID=UPI0029347610|nr:hypothetical protein [Marinomonas sp. GJ51-6]WOD06442.1 hypothetical protein ONZ50_12100 [Marinomonas sp. GJ51-6]
MKSIKSAFALSTVLLATSAHADFLGANAEAGLFSGDDASGSYASLDIQHPIPLIPNVRLDILDLETDDSPSVDVTHFDITGYYGVGLLWLGVEGGLTFRELEIGTTDKSVPMLYLAANLSIPGTGISLAAESKSISSYDDTTISDQLFKIQYQPLPIIGLEAGYRTLEQEIDSINMDYDGYFIGVTIDI